MSRSKSIPAVWRDAARDSGLDATAKLVAYALSTWMSGRGVCYPARASIAAGCSLSLSSVDRALTRLEAQGWVTVERGRGRGRTSLYTASLPEKAADVRLNEWEKASSELVRGVTDAVKGRTRDDRKRVKAKKEKAYEGGIDFDVYTKA